MDFTRIFSYLKALEANNDRTWFHDNHRDYELAREDCLLLLDMLRFELVKLEPEFSEELLFTETKDFMYRVPRDMRYSRSGEPYNPTFRAYLSPHKKELLPLSYYLHLSHHGCYIGTGVWTWLPEQVNSLRSYISRTFEELDMIVAENALIVRGDSLKRVPRGYEEDHPAAEWLKFKSMFTEYVFKPSELTDFDTFVQAAATAMRRFEPLRRYLTGAFTAPVEDEFEALP